MVKNMLQGLSIQGEVLDDRLHRIIYATDASAYREIPLGVVYPKDGSDIKAVVRFAKEKQITLIPRAGGTSLAGQVVGDGLVVDVSRHMNRILEINREKHWVRVEPGVILDDLNQYCKTYGLFFAPEASTSNRCCVGGMVGNNACGSHSLIYGSTRDHLLEARVVLSDGSEVLLKGLTPEELLEKQTGNNLENKIYRQLVDWLADPVNQQEIRTNYPDKTLRRRNSGYALDELLYSGFFDDTLRTPFNLCRLLAGSEGTLAFITELKLNLEPLPPPEKCLICVHCSSLEEAFEANLVALDYSPVAVELMDRTILDLSKNNIEQNRNRFFVQGEPEAILMVELAEFSRERADEKAGMIERGLKDAHYGTHYVRVYGEDIRKVWDLRKAGLGLLSGMPGSAKPVSVIEDTAVAPRYLPAYMSDFRKMLGKYGLSCVFHAHIGTGELHLRPVLDLKKEKDRKLFRTIAFETAGLVRKYKGSLSGEHGDGRLRGEFLPLMYGEKIYGFFKELKNQWDPSSIFNKGKITETPPMDTALRYEKADREWPTYFNFSDQLGWLCAVEQCNGSGDCRKTQLAGGAMCPTYRVTKEERYVTRARANMLREILIHTADYRTSFKQPDMLELLETCIACKACKSECPSNIDMARFKSEYLQHYYRVTHVPLRVWLIARLSAIERMGMIFPSLYNKIVSAPWTSGLLKGMMRFAPEREIPRLYKQTLKAWAKQDKKECSGMMYPKGKVCLFADEFTNYLDVEIGISFIRLLNRLGYQVFIPEHEESGRTELSKGLVKRAKRMARKNLGLLKDVITDDMPLVGIEPSCILTFRDEYPDLVEEDERGEARKLASRCLLFDEFIVREIKKNKITSDSFITASLTIKLHGHCHQKSLASVKSSQDMLSLPQNYQVEVIPSGCCGMAGAFGYEKKNYELSMKIGEEILFPAVRHAGPDICIAAPGTSCRQQIKAGTGRDAYHPIEILYKALK